MVGKPWNSKDKENISEAIREKRCIRGTAKTDSILLISNNGILSSDGSEEITVSLESHT